MSDDRELVERLAAIDATPRASWVAELRADLDAAWETGDTGNLDSLRTTKPTCLDLEPTPTRPPSSRRWPIVIVAAAVVLMLVGALVLVARDEASEPQVPVAPPGDPAAEHGLIALVGRDGDIYVVAPDGTGLRALTSTPGVFETAPAWSPDGTRLAFLRNVRLGGGSELVVIDPATGDETFSADASVSETAPAWSPDGTRLAFLRDVRLGGGGELVVIDPATDDETFAADIPNPPNTDVEGPPEWSPDGRLIVINLTNSICDTSADLETGTWNKICGFIGGWSPDGKWFAFQSGDERRPGLFLVPADLLGTTDLDDVPNLPGVRLLADGGFVSWMPDSSAVAIETARGSIDVVTIADGQRRTLIEDGQAPSWSPDGSHLAYMRCVGEGSPYGSVWVAAADGTGAREVVATSYGAPTWSPGGRLLTLVDADGVFTVRPDGAGITRLAQATRTGFGACVRLPQSFGPVWQPGATEAANTDATETNTTEASATSDG